LISLSIKISFVLGISNKWTHVRNTRREQWNHCKDSQKINYTLPFSYWVFISSVARRYTMPSQAKEYFKIIPKNLIFRHDYLSTSPVNAC
jgi:hypothetical protein